MLKIAEYRNILGEDGKSIRRERIDLQELETFGFVKYNIGHQVKFKLNKKIGNHEIYNIITGANRIIHFNQLSVNNELPNIIYDLIQAGLVEKAEE